MENNQTSPSHNANIVDPTMTMGKQKIMALSVEQ